MLEKYEEPEVIDLNLKSALGNCTPTGSGNVDRCIVGNIAQHTGHDSCDDGNSALGHCNNGNTAVQHCSVGLGV